MGEFALRRVSNQHHPRIRGAGVLCGQSLRYRPLEHRLAFVAFSLMSLVIFVFAPSRSRSRDGVNPAATLALEKENVGIYSIPRVKHNRGQKYPSSNATVGNG